MATVTTLERPRNAGVDAKAPSDAKGAKASFGSALYFVARRYNAVERLTTRGHLGAYGANPGRVQARPENHACCSRPEASRTDEQSVKRRAAA